MGSSGGLNIDRAIFGDGSDGAVTIAANPATLTRDMFYTTLTVNHAIGLLAAGYRVFCSQALLLRGNIQHRGDAGNNGAANGDAGAAPTATATGSIGGSGATCAGGAGGANANGVNGSGNNVPIVMGGSGGNGGAGGDAGANTGGAQIGQVIAAPTAAMGGVRSLFELVRGIVVNGTAVAKILGGGSGAGGSGGAGGGAGAQGAGGGSGGAGGGVILTAAPAMDFNNGVDGVGNYNAMGGDGGDGGSAAGAFDQAGGGGGGGGGGGLIICITNRNAGRSVPTALSANGAAIATGGNAGALGAKTQAGTNGGAGTDGSDGTLIAVDNS